MIALSIALAYLGSLAAFLAWKKLTPPPNPDAARIGKLEADVLAMAGKVESLRMMQGVKSLRVGG